MSYITENYRTDRINKTSTNSDKMKRVLLTLSMSIATLVGTLAQNEPYKNHQLSPKERADDLLGRLTLKEKIGLMQNSSNAVERLGLLLTIGGARDYMVLPAMGWQQYFR